MNALRRPLVVVAACLSLLAGCTGLTEKIDRNAQADTARADQLLGKVAGGDNRALAAPDDVVVKNELWLSGKTIKIARKSTLPGLFEEAASFDGTSISRNMSPISPHACASGSAGSPSYGCR